MRWLLQALEYVIAALVNYLIDRFAVKATPELPTNQFLVGYRLEENQPTREPVYISDKDRSRHVYAIGATGSGKSTVLLRLLNHDLEAARTIVVIDARGDLIRRIVTRLPERFEKGPIPVIMDLSQDKIVTPINPLAGRSDIHARAYHVLDIVRTQSPSWGITIEQQLRNALVALTEANLTLTEVIPLLTNDAFRQAVIKQCTDPTALTYFEQFDRMSEERRQNLSAASLNKIEPFLALPKVRRMLGASSGLDLRTLIDIPGQIILIDLAVDQLHGAAFTLGALLLSSLQQAILSRVDIPESNRVPVHLFVDELENFSSDCFVAFIAEGRRFGLSLTATHQSLIQLPPALRQMLRNNAALTFTFQTGSVDAPELARDVIGLGSITEARALIMGQPVGAAFLNRRGQPSIHVQMPPTKDPPLTGEQIEGMYRRSFEKWGRASSAIDQEIAGRTRPTTILAATVEHERLPRAARRKQ